MKTSKNFWRLVQICISALVVYALVACSSEEGDDPIPPKQEEPTADISFSIGGAGGEGNGSSSSPAVAEKGDTLNLTISQKSSYTDSDGSVTTVEPKATISLFAKLDTLYAKDIKTLVSLNETPNLKTTQSGTEPLLYQTIQKFDVGGQEITFDFGYEIYSLTNLAGKKVEMPYIKVNPAQYGAANTVEENGGTRAAVSAITLKPVAATRGIVVTDSTVYDVTVKFNLNIESVNTPSDTVETLSFEVNYTAVVENSRELPDPEMSFSYEFNVLEGTKDSSSPFMLTLGDTLSLQWRQTSRYTFFSLTDNELKEISCSPLARVKLFAQSDTLWVTDVAELSKKTVSDPVVSTSGENPALTLGKQTFDIGGQKISAEWSSEAYKGLLPDGEEIALPYLTLGEIKLVDVSLTELPDAENADGWVKLYEVTAKFRQDLASVNTSEEIDQSLEYIVKYIGAVKITLVDITYRKDYVWEEEHDNIDPCTRYILYRDRKYSNGETLTDTFISGLCGVEWYLFANKLGGEDWEAESTFEHWHDSENGRVLAFTVNYHNLCHREIGYYGVKDIYKTGVDDISLITTKLRRDIMPEGKPGEHRADYWLMGTNEHYTPENPTPGWYFHGLSRIVSYGVVLYDYCSATGVMYIRDYESMLNFYDRFLYFDNQIFDFHEYSMTYDYDFHEESATTQEGYPARVFTYNSKGTYLGREYNVTLIDTIYQRPAVAN